MKRSVWVSFCVMLVMLVAVGCKDKAGGLKANLPSDFSKMSDQERVDFLVKKSTPDSVARFIVDASLGDIPGVKIDTLMMAQGYAYEKYENQPEEMAIFSSEFERYSASLDLSRKKRLYAMSGMHDPEGFGYDLGLEYVNNIREKHLTVKDVTKEISDFKRACGSDPDTYKRFVKGFKIALEMDHGKGVPEDVYQRFMSLEE